jgi:hypothetical protein
MAAVYLFDFVFPSASRSAPFLFGFLVTKFTADEITFICVPCPLGSPSHNRRMKLAIASCFASSPLSQVLLFREEVRLGVTSPPDHVPDSCTVIAIQAPSAAHLFYGLFGPAAPRRPADWHFRSDEALPDSDRRSSILLQRTFPPELHSPIPDS